MEKKTKKLLIFIFFIVFLFIFLSLYVEASSIKSKNAITSNGNNSIKGLSINISEISGFEGDTKFEIRQLTPSKWIVFYYVNNTLVNDLQDYKLNKDSISSEKGSNQLEKENKKDKASNDFLEKYPKEYSDLSKGKNSKEELDTYVDNIKNIPIKNLSRNVRVSKNNIDLTKDGFFYIEISNFDSKSINRYNGEEIKLGYNSVLFQFVNVDIFSKAYNPSIALDSKGFAHVAYNLIDGLATSPGLVYCNNSILADNAWGYFSWGCEMLDDTYYSNTGSTSIAIDSNDNVYISYYDGTNGDLRICNNTAGWSCGVVDSTNDVGLYNSIAIDQNDKIKIAYYDTTNADLRICNNSAGPWNCSIVQSTGSLGVSPSIAIDKNNITHISFQNGSRLTYTNNSGGSWSFKFVEQTGGNSISNGYPSLAIDLNNNVYISHESFVSTGPRLCRKTPTSSFSCSAVSGSIAWDGLSSLAMDRYNNAHVLSITAIPTAETFWGALYYNNFSGTWKSSKFGDCAGSSQCILSSEVNYYPTDRMIANKLGRLTDSTKFSNYIQTVLYSLDTFAFLDSYYFNPYINVTLNSPSNGTISNRNVNFNCSSYSYFSSLSNITLMLYNSTGLYYNKTNIVTGVGLNSTNFSVDISTDGDYNWNCISYNNQSMYDMGNNDPCYDCGSETFEWVNNSLTTDSTSPNVTITNMLIYSNSLDIQFIGNATDSHLSSCKYMISNSTAEVVSNTSFVCGSTISLALSEFGNYNLTVYANDTTGNEGNLTNNFTLSMSANPKGGGSANYLTISIEKVPTIAIKSLNGIDVYGKLNRSIFFARINSYCSEKEERQPLAVVDYSGKCQLTKEDMEFIQGNLSSQGIKINIDDLISFYEFFSIKRLEQTYFSLTEVEKYGLFPSILGITNELTINPPRLDRPFIITFGSNKTIEYIFTVNKDIKECAILSGDGFSCEMLTNSSIKLKIRLNDTNFFDKVLQGEMIVTSLAGKDTTEVKRVYLVPRVYNFSYRVLGIPVTIILIFGLIILIIVSIFFISRGRIKKNIRRGR